MVNNVEDVQLVLTEVDIGGKRDGLEGLDASEGSSDTLFASSVGLEVIQGATVALPLATHANVDHTELEGLKVDQADGIESEVRDDQGPLKEGIVGVCYDFQGEGERE